MKELNRNKTINLLALIRSLLDAIIASSYFELPNKACGFDFGDSVYGIFGMLSSLVYIG